MPISRRAFLGVTAAGVAGMARPFGWPIGTQVYPIKEALGKDFDAALHDLAAMGYQTIEMCSPQGYGGSSFGPLARMTGSEMRRRIGAVGLGCESCHYTFRELKENLQERIAYAQELGLKQMILSSFSIP